MLPKPTTGGSKTRNLGFGTPQAFLHPTLPPNDANADATAAAAARRFTRSGFCTPRPLRRRQTGAESRPRSREATDARHPASAPLQRCRGRTPGS
jgi:hypothetical protein